MLDNEFHISREGQASLVSIVTHRLEEHTSEVETERSLKELQELLRTLGIKYGNSYIQKRKTIDTPPLLVLENCWILPKKQKMKGQASSFLILNLQLVK